MTGADYTELAGFGVGFAGVWLLAVGLSGVDSAWSVFVGGVLLVVYGVVIVGSANRHGGAGRAE